MSKRDIPKPIKFVRFVKLVQDIAKKSKAKSIAERKAADKHEAKIWPAFDVFKSFSREIQTGPLPSGTTSVIFRLLFPEEDHKRKFGLRDKSLIRDIADGLGISEDTFDKCDGFVGCPGDQVHDFLHQRYSPDKSYCGNLDIFEVNKLLDQLASTSPWSHSDYSKQTLSRNSTKSLLTRKDILKSLYRQMAPYEAAVLTQIILKDLRELLYPQIEKDPTAALKDYNIKAVKILTKESAMFAWDPSNGMNRSYRARWDVDAAANAFESGKEVGPKIGVQIAVPKSQKGRSCKHALSFFSSSSRVWAETKYDGERAQIHVQVIPGQKPRITIFSKSKRDSTGDRKAVHAIILDCLGLSGQSGVEPRIKNSVALDAEMVPCEGTKILEFWRIRRLIRETAVGIRGSRKWSRENNTQTQEQNQPDDCVSESSLLSNTEGQHLGLVFFDVMHRDNDSLVQTPYYRRREILEQLIIKQPGKAMLADRWLINLHEPFHGSPSDCNFSEDYSANDWDTTDNHQEDEEDEDEGAARRVLHAIFARRIAIGEEGLVLKAVDSEYNEYRKPWVKLKKDYIEGLGDTVDLVVLGAACVPDRALELRVPLTTLTTFYIGAQTNKEETLNNPKALPHFYIYFTAAYGLSRTELEGLNFLIRNDDPVRCNTKRLPGFGLKYTYTMYDKLARPELMLREPLAVELYGDRFTVSEGSKQYELRWPRITKYFRRHERSWSECMSLQDLRTQAREAVGRVAAKEVARKEAEITFNLTALPAGQKDIASHRPDDICKQVEMWRVKVAEADKPKRRRRATDKGSREKISALLGKSRKRRPFVMSKSGSLPRKKVCKGDDKTIPSDLAGWCTITSRHSIPRLEISEQPSHIETCMLNSGCNVGITTASDPNSTPRRFFDVVPHYNELFVKDQRTAPLQAPTNTIQTHEGSPQKTFVFTRDENSQSSGTNSPTPTSIKSQFPAMDSPHSKQGQFPSPPVSPMKSPHPSHKDGEDCTSSLADLPATVDPFFRGALFWVPFLKESQSNLPSIKSIVESGTRVNGLDAFLGACRWNPRKYHPVEPPLIRGVVFVDLDDEWGPRWKRDLSERVGHLGPQWRCTDEPRVAIWIFNRRSVFTTEMDVRSQALHVFE